MRSQAGCMYNLKRSNDIYSRFVRVYWADRPGEAEYSYERCFAGKSCSSGVGMNSTACYCASYLGSLQCCAHVMACGGRSKRNSFASV